ncbi:MAG TPA: PIG-L family deacetylase [Bryobacteraceae bacterium]|nr:PIG-L family deacetylase [Bryobacteraceae bacterium]
MVLAAHPDDETIGLASFLREWSENVVVVHVTDGSPRDLRYARAAGFYSQAAYAQARRHEAGAALALASVPAASILALKFIDQEVAYALRPLVERVTALMQRFKPAIVVAHPYEGGHPDHDAVSFAAAAALRLAGVPSRLCEFCSYHASEETLITGEFLPGSVPVCTRQLNAAEQELKRRMFAAYASQSEVLKAFGTESERIRPAPAYDFSAAPHGGRLYYEGRISSLTGACWRSLAVAAAAKLGL